MKDKYGSLAFERERVAKKLIPEALTFLREALAERRKPYVAWSGGKDSTLVLWLAGQVIRRPEAIFFDADASTDEDECYRRAILRRLKPAYRVVKTEPILGVIRRFCETNSLDNDQIEYRTMEATVRRPASTLVKEGYDAALLGLRAGESVVRFCTLAGRGKSAFAKTLGLWHVNPVGWWTVDDVYAAYDMVGLPMHPIYADVPRERRREMRLSYWAGESSRRTGRYVFLRRRFPELWNRLVREVPDALGYR